MTAATACRACGTEPRAGAQFWDGCGAPVTEQDARVEYKQMAVLFADVVRSMDIATTVGPERLREIMADLANRCHYDVDNSRGGEPGMHMRFTLRSPCSAVRRTVPPTVGHAP